MGLFKNKNTSDLIEQKHFEKISFEQFMQDWIYTFPEYDESDEEEIRQIYDDIKLPTRSSSKSAGYDIKSPINFVVKAGDSIMMPTGIRCKIPDDKVMLVFARSGLGSRNRFVPATCTSLIDADYYDSDNEGHIFVKMVNDGDKRVVIEQGKGFCQGMIAQYFTMDDDDVKSKRNGGFGSTDKK